MDGMEYMIAYEFYTKSEDNGPHLIGILPERRKNQKRITHESIMDWGKMFLGDEKELEDLFFLPVKIKKRTGEIIKST